VLDNGLTLVVAPLPHLRTATLALYVKAGSRYESEADNGISHFFEHMLFRGTDAHPSTFDLNLAIEELGGTLDGATHVDYVVYSSMVPRESVLASVELFGEMVSRPLLDGVELEQDIIREEILEGLDDDGNDIDVDDVARRNLFDGHPLGFKITGTLDTIAAFTKDDLRAHQQRFYGARNLVLCVSGAVDHEVVRPVVERAFSSLPAGERISYETPDPRPNAERFVHVHDEGSQTDVRLSYPTFGMRDPRHPTLRLLERILDDGLSTRVHRRICDETGLAYDAFASLESYEDCGVLDFGTQVAHDKTPQVVEALLELGRELCDEEVERRELERARRRFLWDLEAMLDEAGAMVSFYGSTEVLGIRDSLASAVDAVRSVTPSQVRAVAQAVLDPKRAHLTCVGVRTEERYQAIRAALRVGG
jgi:predicted Zn-dependent peptidase